MAALKISFLTLFIILQVCKSEPAPKPLDEINVHFHLDYESSESAEGIEKAKAGKGANRGDYDMTPEMMKEIWDKEEKAKAGKGANRGDYDITHDEMMKEIWDKEKKAKAGKGTNRGDYPLFEED
ncbi:uncharacterized protein LOC111703325 [Eurytemora carolleeae]|uniref:uncharacterized protein LOC111703325 n=1 Tax=Eurytemora carolleeae TaxID=1294199 RepID=UPI000C78026F|nr:uncharacterized protein LOC111703325 [Eurytemora carolleeae]|eukprot:XP_023331000.1 uncharacterized protein LOC111703325 [Eurytemora affinis]